jgi:CoA:oxalate CoA-transferase
VLDRQWANMVKAMGRPELRDDPRFATSPDRVKNRDALNAIVEEWLASMPSDDAAVATLEENRVACAPVLSVLDTMKHPYFKARDMVRKVPDPILGEVTIPGFPLKFSAYPDLPDIQAPLLGEHGAQVLKEVLDYPDSQIARLREDGVLFSENR